MRIDLVLYHVVITNSARKNLKNPYPVPVGRTFSELQFASVVRQQPSDNLCDQVFDLSHTDVPRDGTVGERFGLLLVENLFERRAVGCVQETE